MQDLLFVAVLVAFFALAWLLVTACERIIGDADDAGAPGDAGAEARAEGMERAA